MISNEIAGVRSGDGGELKISSHTLDSPENDGVNLQFVNSNDFMVGKQTNFNGPVTIINYADGKEMERSEEEKFGKEEVVIKERIMAPSVTATMEDFVKKKVENELSLFQASDEKKKELSKHGYCWKTFGKIPIFAWSLLLFLAVAGTVTLAVELAFSEDTYPEGEETIPGETRNYTIYGRRDWGAAPEISSVSIKHPVPYVIITSSENKNCTSFKDCKALLLKIQDEEMKKTRADIYANFLVSSDGGIFEGRGWDKRSPVAGFTNNRNVEINFIGEFTVWEYPTPSQLEAVKALISYGVASGKVSDSYSLIPGNATGIILQRAEPKLGKNLYEKIKGWPNFAPDLFSRLFSPN